MIKLILCIVILFCGAVIGIHLSQKLIRRRDILTQFDLLFHTALIRMEYNAGDLCEVFADNFAGFVFEHTIPFDIQWHRFIDGFTYVLSKEDIEMLRSFTKDLGAADVDSQRQHITLFGELLKEHISQAQDDIQKKAKMYRIIPLSVGMVISLMVI
ncbi:stage III sporulation protein AB [Ruminococcus sp.]|uniref:stage III sporulation protein AB n=1 Tax=Ruminococcus sp. TaxID=41978 RepID=UPI00386FAE30